MAILASAVASVSPARAETRLNFLLGSEFGGGMGAGLELGDRDTFLVGAGPAVGGGYSSVEGWIGFIAPGVSAGYRHYLGGWFVGPTLACNYAATTRSVQPKGTFYATGLLEAGYRWTWASGWSVKLGLGTGRSFNLDTGDPDWTGSVIVGVGLRL